MTKTYAKMQDDAFRQKATEFYVSIQIVGTPDDCLQQVRELHRLTGLDHLITEFAFGGMPHEESEINMRLFADRVIPVLQRDPAFASDRSSAGAAGQASGASASGVFAPA
jgi:alkanesulfonate monooxygenase SsuD/methylene tetrahydromethanopterin reductase-like flavin-dependent oxidoreductase (luciferase family)